MMKLKYSLSAIAALLMASSCSNTELSDLTVGDNANRVEIRLSGRTAQTRSVFSEDALEGNPVVMGMSIWCLASDIINANYAPSPINWWNNESNRNDCIMDNVKANKAYDDFGNCNEVQWDDEGMRYFYPIINSYKYDFYACWPYAQTVYKGSEGANTLQVEYELDGKTDVLWGKAHSEDQYAYSGKYFHTYGAGAALPQLDLRHALTRFDFVCTPGQNADGNCTLDQELLITSLSIIDTYSHIDLLVADRDNESSLTLDQRVRPAGERDGEFLLCEADDSEMLAVTVPTTAGEVATIGGHMLVCPQRSYRVRMELQNTEDEKIYVSEFPLTVQSEDPDATFKAGTRYKVTIRISNVEEINLRARIADWDEDPDNNPDIAL